LALLAALCLTAGAAAAFSDVDEGSWYSDEVAYVVQEGLMKGVSQDLFAPEWAVTRATVVTVLYRMEGEPGEARDAGFPDVGPSVWYGAAVAWAKEAGIAAGYGSGAFGPDDPVTREQLAVFLWRYAKYKGTEIAAGVLGGYGDAGAISSWAEDGMKHAVGAGLITGKNGELLDPSGVATRAELAAILQRLATPVSG
jgi:hypothetical protein